MIILLLIFIVGRGHRIKEPFLHTSEGLVEELAQNIMKATGDIDREHDAEVHGPIKVVFCGHGLGAIGTEVFLLLLYS